MKKLVLLLIIPLFFTQSCDVMNQSGILSQADVANGLKAALNMGVDQAARTLTKPSTYGGNVLVNNLLPPNAVKVLNTAKSLGFGQYVDRVTNTLNTAAINTVKQSVPIFKNSINQLTFKDAWGVLKGGQGAGTEYLKRTSYSALNNAVNGQVSAVFKQLGVKPNLLANFGIADNPMLNALNLDLQAPLSNLVTNEIFKSITTQENKIRTDVSSRSTALLQRVFAAANVAQSAR